MCVVSCLLFAGCCLLVAGCCLLCVMFGVLLFAVRSLHVRGLCVVGRSLPFAVCSLLFGYGCLLSAACCVWYGVSFVACCLLLCVVGCLRFVVCCLRCVNCSVLFELRRVMLFVVSCC